MNKFWIANFVTGFNGFCGALSIFMAVEGLYDFSAILILVAMVADFLDGRVARALHTAGPLGVELDSLCDNISFGIAPATLLYTSQLRDYEFLALIPCALLAVACAGRLARFNVRSSEVHGYFQGLPCPMTGMITAGYILSGVVLWPPITIGLILLIAFLMVSEIHYPDNKGAGADQLHWQSLVICLALMGGLTFMEPTAWFAALCLSFILFGILNTWQNRRKAARKRRKIRRKRTGEQRDV